MTNADEYRHRYGSLPPDDHDCHEVERILYEEVYAAGSLLFCICRECGRTWHETMEKDQGCNEAVLKGPAGRYFTSWWAQKQLKDDEFFQLGGNAHRREGLDRHDRLE